MKKSTKKALRKGITKTYETIGALLSVGGFISMAGGIGCYVQTDDLKTAAIIFGVAFLSFFIGSAMIGEVMNMNLENE